MIEPIMYFGIGFLVAALLGLLFVPLVHERAVRLTMRRLEAATPLSIAEIRADKDQLRAEFAMSTRRLEMSVEQMKAKTTGQLAELGKKTGAIIQLKKELGEKTAAIFALESRDRNLRDQLRATEDEFTLKSDSLRGAERALADKEAELAKLLAELGERSIMADSQRVELAALRAQVEAIKVSVTDYERAVRATEERLARQRTESEAATAQSNEARSKLDELGTRTAELERQLAERQVEIQRLCADLEGAKKIENELRQQLGSAGVRSGGLVNQFRADIAQLEAQLAAAIEERAKLQDEIASMRRDTDSTERIENALLRERVNDVAAEVARLTATLEGPSSPIEAILALGTPAAAKGGGGSPGANSANPGTSTSIESPRGKGTLAERIRALQSTASRAAS
jgi:chromosome segregation ATPase